MIILCSATAVVVSFPLIRRYDDQNIGSQEQAIYQDQLSEVDRDLSVGTINAPEADAARSEIRRRLAASEAIARQSQPLSTTWKMLALALTTGLVILGSVLLYAQLGAPQMPSVATSQPTSASTNQATDSQAETMIATLLARLQSNPKDAEGWRMLGWAQFNSRHYAEAADAYAKALEIDPTNSDYKSAYAESLTLSAGGIVTPKSLTLFTEVLAKNPKDYRARFYDALAHEQSGDKSGALDRLIALLADSPAEAGWREEVRNRIVNLGKATGRDVASVIRAPTAPQITDEQKSQIQALPADDQLVMIKGMVAKLADKLKANPSDPDGWIKLIRSYQVLNDPAAAKQALTMALITFTNDPVNKEKVTVAANELGVK